MKQSIVHIALVVRDYDEALDFYVGKLGFDELMRSAQSRGRGEYLGVEPDIGRNVYRFKFLRSGGNVVWVDVDGRTGRVIAERDCTWAIGETGRPCES